MISWVVRLWRFAVKLVSVDDLDTSDKWKRLRALSERMDAEVWSSGDKVDKAIHELPEK